MVGNDSNTSLSLTDHGAYFCYDFLAMASPCQLLIESNDSALATHLAISVQTEVQRIEQKFSRYLGNNICYKINNSNGERVTIDDECHRLLTFADDCFEISDGMFDISSGVLRRAWHFDCGDQLPSQADIDKLLPYTGWNKVNFDTTSVQLAPGMELDFGGIGKEYAASTAADLCRKVSPHTSVLINLGGDIQISHPRKKMQPWLVGIENNEQLIPIVEGALATSGDAKRYLMRDGIRYSHILNPKTGWPIQGAPASVTTHAPLCIQAGMLATLSLLNGENAENFLTEHDVQYWITQA